MVKYRKAIFIVTYARTKKGIEYLILKRKLHWKGWEFPKGGIKFFETKRGAVKRELKEETGLNALKVKKFNNSGTYRYNKKFPDRKGFIGQNFQLYATEVKKSKVVFGREHSDYKWVGFKEALKKLRWPNQRKSLKIVNTLLKK
jgi:8-oxo-dGTP pyrophosphatase MutT (NUDIX family)